MALPWIRLDTSWPQNPKFLMLVGDKKYKAVTVYMAGLAWAGAQGQDGFIPFYALPSIHAVKKDAHDLVEVGLWEPAQGGWQIHDWAEYQPSSEANEARSRKARDAAHARWNKSSRLVAQ